MLGYCSPHDICTNQIIFKLRILYTSQIIMGGVASRLQGGEAIRRAEDSGEEVKTHLESLEALISRHIGNTASVESRTIFLILSFDF